MRPFAPPDLPIVEALPRLRAALAASSRAVLEAPPGAGKTTVVPLDLLGAPWLAGQKIVVLEPRRLAAKAAARRMASLLGEAVGETVGYRIRMEARVSARTRVEVVTEGILTRMLQDDASLEGVGCVVFDEFHERSLHADLGLALALDAQEALRPDLRLLVMSATLDADRLGTFLDAPVVTSRGRTFPVDLRYLRADEAADRTQRPAERLAALVPKAVHRALREQGGDVLVFLPGMGEMRRVEERLAVPDGVAVHLLHGDLSTDAQDAALAPAPPGTRKVVLATSIAETSLTIPGVTAVVDGGLARVPRFDARTEMPTLATVPVSVAAADQRAGRAGRVAPGVAYRLWTTADHDRLAAHHRPEVVEADLTPLALELAIWGVPDASGLQWLDPPPAATLAAARALLVRLGATTPDGAVTPHGRRLATLGLHPRLGHLVVAGNDFGHGATACALAALLSERDVLPASDGPRSPDLALRLDVLRRGATPAARRAKEMADHLRKRLGIAETRLDPEALGLLTALAYPDRIGQVEDETRLRLATGQRVALDPHAFPQASFVAVAHLGGSGKTSAVQLAAPLTLAGVERVLDGQIETVEAVRFDAQAERVVARRQRVAGALVLSDAPLPNPSPEAVARALIGEAQRRGLHVLTWTKEAVRLRERLLFLHHHLPNDWPDVSDEALLGTLGEWLGTPLLGAKSLTDVAKVNMEAALTAAFVPWSKRSEWDRLAPSHVVVPTGSNIPVDYADPAKPVLAVRLQEVFGLIDTPRVLGGTLPLTMHLLSPAHRPAAVTQDLRSFWAGPYFDVRKDLRGRYPKHVWPDDPLAAAPTRRAKPR